MSRPNGWTLVTNRPRSPPVPVAYAWASMTRARREAVAVVRSVAVVAVAVGDVAARLTVPKARDVGTRDAEALAPSAASRTPTVWRAD